MKRSVREPYSLIDYQVMFAVCAVGRDHTDDITTPKTVTNIVRIVNQFPNTDYSREQIVRTMDSLVALEMLNKVGDRYNRHEHVLCRNIGGLCPDGRRLMAIIEMFADDTQLVWSWMLAPEDCDQYNEAVGKVLDADFAKDMVNAEGSLAALRGIVKRYKVIDVPVPQGKFGMGSN